MGIKPICSGPDMVCFERRWDRWELNIRGAFALIRNGLLEDLTPYIDAEPELGRVKLTHRELLGTWEENAAGFTVGETVVGIVRSVEEYGTFVEIAPNLAGLAETCPDLHPGQAVSVYIKNILPDKMKIKLVVVNKNLGQPLRFEPHYFVTRGRLKRWTYSTPQSRKQIETVF